MGGAACAAVIIDTGNKLNRLQAILDRAAAIAPNAPTQVESSLWKAFESKVHECFACVEALDGCVDEYEAAVAALE